MMKAVTKGKKGEELAVAFLIKNGYAILERNFRNRDGEIDIIAARAGIIAFIEVKTWDALQAVDIEYAVNRTKIRKIIKTARYYLMSSRQYSSCVLRFDLIFITDNCNKIEHIENAFSED